MTQDLVQGWTKPYLRHRISFRYGLEISYDTEPRLGLEWALLTAQDLTWGWTGPYDTGPRLRRDWTLLRAQDFAQNVTQLETEQDLTQERASIGTELYVTKEYCVLYLQSNTTIFTYQQAYTLRFFPFKMQFVS